MRKAQWVKYGCNITGTNPHSNPMSFWTNQDVLQYIYENKLEIADCYGEVIRTKDGNYANTGVNRTGCAFCLFGASRDRRFSYLRTHQPQTYDYVMGGGEFNEEGNWVPNKKGLGMAFVIEFLNKHLRRKIVYNEPIQRSLF